MPKWLTEQGQTLAMGRHCCLRMLLGRQRCIANRSWLWPVSYQKLRELPHRPAEAVQGGGALPGLAGSSRGSCCTTYLNPRDADTALCLSGRLHGREIAEKKAVSALRVWLMFLQHLKTNRKNRFARGFKRHQVAWIPDPVSTQKVIIKQEICLS